MNDEIGYPYSKCGKKLVYVDEVDDEGIMCLNCYKNDSMIIYTEIKEMKYILLKFLKDSLDFLCDDPSAKGMVRSKWAEKWMAENLTDFRIQMWTLTDND